MSKRPVIGIVLSGHLDIKQNRSKLHTLKNIFAGLADKYNIVLFPLLQISSLIEQYISHIDGLILTGGGFDMPPQTYGSLKHHETLQSNPDYAYFEMELAKQFLTTHKPIFGIGGGQELLSVVLGGTIVQDIPHEIDHCINHLQKPPFNLPSHSVSIKPQSLLHSIVQNEIIQVNSLHHQATRDIPEDIRVSAVAPDGVIEGIEHPNHPFCIGVLWHPEYLASPADDLLLQAFFKAC